MSNIENTEYSPLVAGIYNGTVALYTEWIHTDTYDLVDAADTVTTAYQINFPSNLPSMSDWEGYASTLLTNQKLFAKTLVGSLINFGSDSVVYTSQVTQFDYHYTTLPTSLYMFTPFITFFTSLQTYLNSDSSSQEFENMALMANNSWSFLIDAAKSLATGIQFVYGNTEELYVTLLGRWGTSSNSIVNNDLDGLLETVNTKLNSARDTIAGDLINAVTLLQNNLKSGKYLTTDDTGAVSDAITSLLSALGEVNIAIQATLGGFYIPAV